MPSGAGPRGRFGCRGLLAHLLGAASVFAAGGSSASTVNGSASGTVLFRARPNVAQAAAPAPPATKAKIASRQRPTMARKRNLKRASLRACSNCTRVSNRRLLDRSREPAGSLIVILTQADRRRSLRAPLSSGGSPLRRQKAGQ